MSDARLLRVLTPEHVELALEPAGPGRRFLALVVDATCCFALAAAAGLLASPLGPGVSHAVGVTAGLVLSIGWPVAFELRARGRTPGKRLLGLRVVDVRGLPLLPSQSIARNVLRLLDGAPAGYGVGVVACLLSRSSRRLGDLAGATVVVRERALAPPRIELPPAARRYNSLDTPEMARRIRNRLGLEERELLLAASLRAPRLEERARLELMEEVGAHYRAALGIDDAALSGESLVHAILAICFPSP